MGFMGLCTDHLFDSLTDSLVACSFFLAVAVKEWELVGRIYSPMKMNVLSLIYILNGNITFLLVKEGHWCLMTHHKHSDTLKTSRRSSLAAPQHTHLVSHSLPPIALCMCMHTQTHQGVGYKTAWEYV